MRRSFLLALAITWLVALPAAHASDLRATPAATGEPGEIARRHEGSEARYETSAAALGVWLLERTATIRDVLPVASVGLALISAATALYSFGRRRRSRTAAIAPQKLRAAAQERAADSPAPRAETAIRESPRLSPADLGRLRRQAAPVATVAKKIPDPFAKRPTRGVAKSPEPTAPRPRAQRPERGSSARARPGPSPFPATGSGPVVPSSPQARTSPDTTSAPEDSGRPGRPAAPIAPVPPAREPEKSNAPAAEPGASQLTPDRLEEVILDAWSRALLTPEEPRNVAEPEARDARGGSMKSEAETRAPRGAEPSLPDPPPAPKETVRAPDRPEGSGETRLAGSESHELVPRDYSRLCEALLEKRRFESVAALAREGLEEHPDDGALLLSLSRALVGLGRADAALQTAREAHRTSRSRDSLLHLIRLLTAARRFDPEDGGRLRRAVGRHPGEPLLLHAAGVFEALHGDPWAARGLLLEALRHEKREEIRQEVSRELALLETLRQQAHPSDAAPGGAPLEETAASPAAAPPAGS